MASRLVRRSSRSFWLPPAPKREAPIEASPLDAYGFALALEAFITLANYLLIGTCEAHWGTDGIHRINTDHSIHLIGHEDVAATYVHGAAVWVGY